MGIGGESGGATRDIGEFLPAKSGVWQEKLLGGLLPSYIRFRLALTASKDLTDGGSENFFQHFELFRVELSDPGISCSKPAMGKSGRQLVVEIVE